MTELKPCPFCGGRGVLHASPTWDGGIRADVYCEDCYASTQACSAKGVLSEAASDQAIKLWNRRAERKEDEDDE